MNVEANNSQEEVSPPQINLPTSEESYNESYSQEIPKIKPIVIVPLDKIPVTGDKASAVGADYTYLQYLLDKKQFGLADLETTNVMLWIAKREKDGYFEMEDIRNFPFPDINTINQLWFSASEGKFGFSVQKQIWIDLDGKLKLYDDNSRELADIFQRFKSKVEWKEDKVKSDLFNDRRTAKGHLPLGVYAKLSKDWKIHQIWRTEIEKELKNNEVGLDMEIIGGASLELQWELGLNDNNKSRDLIRDIGDSLGNGISNGRAIRTSCRRILRYLSLLSRTEF